MRNIAADGDVHDLPSQGPGKAASPVTGVRLHVVAAAVSDESGRILLSRRPVNTHQGGKWEFPGGKVERGESPVAALARELEEELGIRPAACEPLITVLHDYPDKRIRLEVWRVLHHEGTATGREGQEVRWVQAGELREYDFPDANLPVITALDLPDRYLITPDPGRDTESFLRTLERSLLPGVFLVQFRATNLGSREYESLAREVLSICRSAGARCLLNADPERALMLGAEGVHLNARRVRQWQPRTLPRELTTGASCHDPAGIRLAQACRADFAVLSPVRATPSHPDAVPIGWDTFAEFSLCARIPVFALGGVGPEDVPLARSSGGQGVAAIRGLWASRNPGN